MWRSDVLTSTTHYNPTFKTCGGMMSYPQPHIITTLLRHVANMMPYPQPHIITPLL